MYIRILSPQVFLSADQSNELKVKFRDDLLRQFSLKMIWRNEMKVLMFHWL